MVYFDLALIHRTSERKVVRKVIDKIKADLIAKTFYQPIYKYCYTNLDHNPHDASDVTQDVFVIFQEKKDTLEDTYIKSWLFSVAWRKVKEIQRKTKKDMANVPIDDDFDIIDEDADIFELLEEENSFDSEKLEKYRNIIYEKLTDKERELYHKIYVEKKKYKQIAEELNTTNKAISVRATRLRRKLELMEFLVFYTLGQVILKIFF